MLIARLHPPERKEGVRYNGLYCVEFGGELIVVDSRDPEPATRPAGLRPHG